jgi:Ca2+/Na+ antiporter
VYGYVTKWESLAFVCWYLVYILFMVFNDRLFALLGCANSNDSSGTGSGGGLADEAGKVEGSGGSRMATKAPADTTVMAMAAISVQPGDLNGDLESGGGGMVTISLDGDSGASSQQQAVAVRNPMHLDAASKDNTAISSGKGATSGGGSKEEDEDQDESGGVLGAASSALACPWLLLFSLTVPDCSPGAGRERWFGATFALSCIWIGALSWSLVYCATEFGALAGINSIVMGVVFLAAGTSVPDAISSVVVARQGKGSMAVANAIGSNVFDICLGIGLPYLLATAGLGRAPIPIATEDLGVNVLILVATVLTVVGALAAAGWRLTPRVSWVLLACYAAFVLYNLVI